MNGDLVILVVYLCSITGVLGWLIIKYVQRTKAKPDKREGFHRRQTIQRHDRNLKLIEQGRLFYDGKALVMLWDEDNGMARFQNVDDSWTVTESIPKTLFHEDYKAVSKERYYYILDLRASKSL